MQTGCCRPTRIAAMTWAPYDLVEQDDRKIVFRRRLAPG
jgi:hypothetical protein